MFFILHFQAVSGRYCKRLLLVFRGEKEGRSRTSNTCGQVLVMARIQVLQNCGSWMVVLRFTTLSARDSHCRNSRKNNCREHSNIKSARVSALTGSVPRKMASAQLQNSAPYRTRIHVFRPYTSLDHSAIGSY